MKILAADKDSRILELIAARLGSRHYEVTTTTRSEDAIRYLSRDKFDLALISTQMERVRGRLLIQKIREKQHLGSLPIIMLTTEEDVSEMIMSYERGFDDFLLKPFKPLVLQLRVATNIARTRARSEANALTHLPGNVAIEEIIRKKIEDKEKFSVLYIDLNNFKSFNDHYGFVKGDDALRQTARLLLQTRDEICPEGDCFVGHIGGDDFVVLLNPYREERYAEHLMSEFDRIMPTYYHEEDRKRGFIEVKNRRGESETFPLISCSIAACTNLYREYKNIGEISQDATEVKSFLKSQPGSSYLRDRRSSPIVELEKAADMLAPAVGKLRKKPPVDPLGKTLLDAGLINEEQLARAMKRHMLTGQRLGQTLIGMNLVRSEDVGRMLERKLNVSYVSLKTARPSRAALRLFTVDFMKMRRVAPLEISDNRLKLAMCDPFDIKTLDAIEQISGLKPVPLLALEDEFEQFIENLPQDRAEEALAS